MADEYHKVPRVPDTPAEQRLGRLVQLEGEVRRRRQHREDEDDVRVRHVDEASRYRVRNGQRGEEVERRVDGVLAPPLVKSVEDFISLKGLDSG